MTGPRRPPPRRPRLAGARWRGWLLQLALVAVLVAAVWLLASVTASHMRARGIRSGFDFLADQAGFDIGEGWLRFDATQPYWRAFLAGLANTFRAVVPAVVACTLLGVLLGVGRLAQHPLLRGACTAWVELVRNIPLLLQLLTWYLLLTEYLPGFDEPWHWGFASLSKAGLAFGGDDGLVFTPEYLAVVLGLSVYTSAYVAEVVRAGVQAVPFGQLEAAATLGLTRVQQLRLVLLPQALRLVVPPLTNQYLNLLKNSSLAVAVGYPELVSVANTAINQSGRALECITVLLGVYLVLSLLTAAAMEHVNRRAARQER